jgi:hypothetical protein
MSSGTITVRLSLDELGVLLAWSARSGEPPATVARRLLSQALGASPGEPRSSLATSGDVSGVAGSVPDDGMISVDDYMHLPVYADGLPWRSEDDPDWLEARRRAYRLRDAWWREQGWTTPRAMWRNGEGG